MAIQPTDRLPVPSNSSDHEKSFTTKKEKHGGGYIPPGAGARFTTHTSSSMAIQPTDGPPVSAASADNQKGFTAKKDKHGGGYIPANAR